MFNINTFKIIIDTFYKCLLETPEERTGVNLSEEKWSLKEIVGHLIDSASNNHQRFVRLQCGDLLNFPMYDGEVWLKKQNYNSMNWNELIALWYNYNCLLLNIIDNCDERMYENVWVTNDEISLKLLINHYYKHLNTHINHFNVRKNELIC